MNSTPGATDGAAQPTLFQQPWVRNTSGDYYISPTPTPHSSAAAASPASPGAYMADGSKIGNSHYWPSGVAPAVTAYSTSTWNAQQPHYTGVDAVHIPDPYSSPYHELGIAPPNDSLHHQNSKLGRVGDIDYSNASLPAHPSAIQPRLDVGHDYHHNTAALGLSNPTPIGIHHYSNQQQLPKTTFTSSSLAGANELPNPNADKHPHPIARQSQDSSILGDYEHYRRHSSESEELLRRYQSSSLDAKSAASASIPSPNNRLSQQPNFSRTQPRKSSPPSLVNQLSSPPEPELVQPPFLVPSQNNFDDYIEQSWRQWQLAGKRDGDQSRSSRYGRQNGRVNGSPPMNSHARHHPYNLTATESGSSGPAGELRWEYINIPHRGSSSDPLRHVSPTSACTSLPHLHGSPSHSSDKHLALITPDYGSKPTEQKKVVMACLFCRERKIACGPPPEGSVDKTCNQCARRHLTCEYPTESFRGQRGGRKKKVKVEPTA
ncbi:hypothetical protein JAAARDRAFT_40854 [Jaapia argillacea MUCL 33604]|uniref:Zn(2)-C6 fungal-type domain-containing protein n=1 Tax=Jaapia argillacea MUCL 33604 TaxID=933084 RepID=A0A067PA38_9AGAM|nr:hypothetical protein JAAARDRAFT_40854 [Jaapia argillacea MUCL 33604]